MVIHSYENTLRADACIEYLRGVNGVDIFENIILLPIPSTKDKKTILNTKVSINELISTFDANTFVSGYGLPDDFVRAATERGVKVVDLSSDEEFLLENADLTALCTLGIVLNTTLTAVREARIGVVGYGRIGKRLVNIFLYLGATVRVFTSRPGTRLDLCENGVASVISSAEADLSDLDLLINTAPARIFAADSIPEGLRIIDLASGDNFPDVEVEKYPSVPAKMFPVSAGRAWGRALERYLVNNP